jgi:hypothetical protein
VIEMASGQTKHKQFKTLLDALRWVLPNDADRPIVRHFLAKGKEVPTHYHPKAREWVVLYQGVLALNPGLQNGGGPLNASDLIQVLEIPSGVSHFSLAFSDCKYFVIRSKRDKIVYCKYLGTKKERLAERKKMAAIRRKNRRRLQKR